RGLDAREEPRPGRVRGRGKADAHETPASVREERRVDLGPVVRHDGESGDHAVLLARAEEAAEAERREDVAVHDEEARVREAADLSRAPDAAGGAEDLRLVRNGDRKAAVSVRHRARQL